MKSITYDAQKANLDIRQYGEIIKEQLPNTVDPIEMAAQAAAAKLVETKAIDQMTRSKALNETATQNVLQDSQQALED